MLSEVSYTPPQKFILYNPINPGKCKPMYSNRLVVVWGRLCVCVLGGGNGELDGKEASGNFGHAHRLSGRELLHAHTCQNIF